MTLHSTLAPLVEHNALLQWQSKATLFSKLIREWNQKGWSPATSTNYSFRDDSNFRQLWISSSGIDKAEFGIHHFMQVNLEGKAVSPLESRKPSAETLLHTLLYAEYHSCNSVAHTHSKYATVLSELFPNGIEVSGYELLKAFPGIHTHDIKVTIPVFENTQDMEALSAEIKAWLAQGNQFVLPVFILRQHGTYFWGNSIQDTKRHVEAVEFLLECTFLKKQVQ